MDPCRTLEILAERETGLLFAEHLGVAAAFAGMVKGLWGIEWYKHGAPTSAQEQLKSVQKYYKFIALKDNPVRKGFWILVRYLTYVILLLGPPYVIYQEVRQQRVGMGAATTLGAAECKCALASLVLVTCTWAVPSPAHAHPPTRARLANVPGSQDDGGRRDVSLQQTA